MTAKYALAACLPIAALAIGCSSPSPAQPEDWPVYRGDAGSQGFSSLAQIDTSNVARLELAWTFEPPGDERLTIECNPIVIDGVLYALSPGLRAFALDAATGAMRWFFDPDDYGVRPWNGQPHGRGLAYWSDGSDRRLFLVAQVPRDASWRRNTNIVARKLVQILRPLLDAPGEVRARAKTAAKKKKRSAKKGAAK